MEWKMSAQTWMWLAIHVTSMTSTDGHKPTILHLRNAQMSNQWRTVWWLSWTFPWSNLCHHGRENCWKKLSKSTRSHKLLKVWNSFWGQQRVTLVEANQCGDLKEDSWCNQLSGISKCKRQRIHVLWSTSCSNFSTALLIMYKISHLATLTILGY